MATGYPARGCPSQPTICLPGHLVVPKTQSECPAPGRTLAPPSPNRRAAPLSAIDTIPSLKQWRAEQSRLRVVLLSPEADTAHILRASDSSRFRITHVSAVDDALAIAPPPDVLLFPTMMGENRLLRLHRALHRQGCAFLLAGSIRYASPEISRIGRAVIGWPIHLLELTDVLED